MSREASALRRADAQAGFTLLEALVALVILTGTASGVTMLVASNRTLQARSEDELRRALAAEAVLNRVGLDIPLTAGAVTGTAAGGLGWQVIVRPYSDADEPDRPRARPLYEVEVRVPAGPGGPGVVLRSLKRGPA